MAKKLTLIEAPRALMAHIAPPPTYHQLWMAAVAGRIPAEKVGKRWMIRAADLERIAKTFTSA